MKFCKNCGKEMSNEVVFCTSCGQGFENEVSTPNTVELPKAVTNPPSPPTSRKPMSKMQKALIFIIAIIIFACIVANIVLTNVYDPIKKIEAMNIAYNNKDKDTFFNAFHFKEGTVANPQNFYATVSEYGWINLRNDLTNEIEKIKRKEHTDIIYNDGEFINVQKKPVLLGLYNDIEFTIIPVEVSVWAPYENMKFNFGGKEVISKANEEQIIIGNFIPGTYEWSYEYDEGIMPLSGKGAYSLHNYWDNTEMVDVDWDFRYITLESDLEDAIVYVGGKSTGKKVSELYSLYPAQLNPTVEVFAVAKDKDGNEVKSDILTLDSTYVYLPFEHYQREQRIAEREWEIQDLYKSFRSDYSTAIYYTNFSYIEDYFIDGSKIKQDYAKFVTDHDDIEGYYYYEFILNDITDIKVISETEFELYTFETFNFQTDNESLYYERKKKYVFSYIDDKFYITEITDLDTKKTKNE
ncbi:hypothetical protein QTL97_04510 [Sporosarcina thermotolerans]|uniref:Zinc-ribbon domain-containing protein n=1 Tax=Sporosarcina thermotolerans TaxID=633404 RepID=A0AAW9A5I8_9BACL|nr:hypothetical protein [Sporosarcina thermotolerans]MDW0116184.1 hypothetical protein [Sporosarcina thermotolerans]WHT48160.1 hypothetical protein QNH10_19390 [Sporosarcina thermotolerans]